MIEGIRNDIKLEHGDLVEDEMDEIIRRRLICSECPFNSVNAIKAGWYLTERNDEHCTCCGCPVSRKTASLSSNCGAEVRNQQKSDQPPLELKWLAYDKGNN